MLKTFMSFTLNELKWMCSVQFNSIQEQQTPWRYNTPHQHTLLSTIYPFIHPFMHVPPIWADRSCQQVRREPPDCLLAVLCPAPSAGSCPPHCRGCIPLPCSHLRPQSCLFRPVCTDVRWGSRRSSWLAATPGSWLAEELPQCSCERSCHGPSALSNPQPWLAESCFSMVWLSLGSLNSIKTKVGVPQE